MQSLIKFFLFAALAATTVLAKQDDLSPMYACIKGDVTGWIKPVYNVKDGPDANSIKEYLMTVKTELSGFDGREGGCFSIMDGICAEGMYGSNYYKSNKLEEDPFPVMFKTNKRGKSVKRKIKVNNGFPKSKGGKGKNEGKIIVVYDSDGDVVGCGVIDNSGKEDCEV